MKNLLGIWDVSRSGLALGRLLVFLEELEIERQINRADKVEIALVADARCFLDDSRFPGHTIEAGSMALPDSHIIAPTLTVLRAMPFVTGIRQCTDPTSVQAAMTLANENHVLWPAPERLVQGTYDYDSTQRIQAAFAQSGSIPSLSVNARLLTWAGQYLQNKAMNRLPVAVHLKSNPNITGQSNANLAAWRQFFTSGPARAAHFFLVGNDATNETFLDMPNVTVTHRDGVSIDGHLALIQSAALFMGMMSGPSVMAICGTRPYVIFKNPDHHVEQMAVELGTADRYVFARPNQRILRIWDTAEHLLSAFETATQAMVLRQ